MKNESVNTLYLKLHWSKRFQAPIQNRYAEADRRVSSYKRMAAKLAKIQ